MKPLTDEQRNARMNIYWALRGLTALRQARVFFNASNSPRTLERTRSAIDSAGGTVRAARGRATKVGFFDTTPICLAPVHGVLQSIYETCIQCGENLR